MTRTKNDRVVRSTEDKIQHVLAVIARYGINVNYKQICEYANEHGLASTTLRQWIVKSTYFLNYSFRPGGEKDFRDNYQEKVKDKPLLTKEIKKRQKQVKETVQRTETNPIPEPQKETKAIQPEFLDSGIKKPFISPEEHKQIVSIMKNLVEAASRIVIQHPQLKYLLQPLFNLHIK